MVVITMPSSHPKQGDHDIPSLRQKSIQSVKTLLSPRNPRQFSKLLQFSPLKISSSEQPLKSTPAFHLFRELPSEIRTMIWSIYITFPRIHIPIPSTDSTPSNPSPLILTRAPQLHPSLYISHESRSTYQQTCWLETLRRMHMRTRTGVPISHPPSASFTSHSFMHCLEGNEMINWDTDIFWFKGISTVKRLSEGSLGSQMKRYEDVRKVALDYTVLDYEEESEHWRRRFKIGWYGLVCVLHLFEYLEEVYFVLDAEGDVRRDVKGDVKGNAEVSFEMVDVEERVRRRLEGVNAKVGADGDGLCFPQLDERGVYPALERLFSRWERCHGWQKPRVQFVYARNIG
ncbi:378ead12-ad65-4281-8a45-34121b7b8d50 [Sclerotinia trifoliorum]|uniref:378ead12-ad65-4281-8a45-34121b7b8d50 n=1 Tax=Sclerotinia trifoliorum TaxID=28548 RepID=A0A8H2W2M0_9HELO|nr:378ead12-ad65-4281-8a45-34121b7b8d50 [Sclerotinia trifoliorum]